MLCEQLPTQNLTTRILTPRYPWWAYFSVRSRLEDLLAQYELRERHFEAVMRSKQLELLLAKARVDEQKSLVESEREHAKAAEQQVNPQSPYHEHGFQA